jgi:hypothetical protein
VINSKIVRALRIAESLRRLCRVGIRVCVAAALACTVFACAPVRTDTLTPADGHGLPVGSAARVLSPGTVFLIVMENKEYDQVIGSSEAPFINALAQQYTLVSHAYAMTHPSLPNYLALLGGDTFGVTSDCTTCFLQMPNLVDSLEARGRSWKAYMEDLPSPCFVGDAAGEYALRHDPFLYFDDIRNTPARCQHVVPLTELGQDLDAESVPDFAWISPNLVHDMHDGSVETGDTWLAGFVPRLLASSAWKRGGTLILTWDEGTTDAGCCGVSGGGHIATIVVQPNGTAGARLDQPASHYSTLRTIEDLLQVDRVGQSAGDDVNDLTTDDSAPLTTPRPTI